MRREQDIAVELRKWKELPPGDGKVRMFAYIDGVRLLAKVENTLREQQRATGALRLFIHAPQQISRQKPCRTPTRHTLQRCFVLRPCTVPVHLCS